MSDLLKYKIKKLNANTLINHIDFMAILLELHLQIYI